MDHPEKKVQGGTVVGLVKEAKPEKQPETKKTAPKKSGK